MPQKMEKYRLKKIVNINHLEHANLDSFPLRYGFTFTENTKLEILCDPSTLRPDKNPKFKDRYNIVAKFTNPKNFLTERGVFYLINNQKNKNYVHDKVITIIRYLDERETEHHLTEVIRALRESNDITSQDLIKLHPMYMSRQLGTHADLIRILVDKTTSHEVLRIQTIADKAVEKFKNLMHEIDDLNTVIIDLEEENIEIKKELDEYKTQEKIANMQGSTQTLERVKTLLAVNTEVMHRGSSCTELVMDDGTRLHMKTITFDRDLQVTAKAKTLVGRKVKTSCWDPIREPGKWSSQGYFRNVYALSDEDFSNE
jgi:hypothetical protein